jgi:hypothetical protein
MAENNGNYSAALKNDWCLRISGKVFQGKANASNVHLRWKKGANVLNYR